MVSEKITITESERFRLDCLRDFIIAYGKFDRLDSKDRIEVWKKLEKLRIKTEQFYIR